MKEQKRKEKKQIVVIDKGIDPAGPCAYCCNGTFIPFR